MSADISFNGSGQAEIVLRNEPAWHGLGEVFQSEPGNRLTSDKIAELCPSVFFNVDKQPIYLGDGSAVPGFYATVRTDCDRALGVVGERYTVYQNKECFAFLDELVKDGTLEYESAMALNGGAKVALLARLPEVSAIDPEGKDRIMRHLLLSTTHDGSGAVDIFPTNTRVVCANTLALAKGGAGTAPYRVTVKHTASMRDSLALAQAFIAEAEVAFGQFIEKARTLATIKCTGEQAKAFVEALYPAPTDGLGHQLESGKKLTIHNKKLDDIRDAIRHESNVLPYMRGTWWQMLNAITYNVDHNSRVRAANDRDRAENRFDSVIYGKGSALKSKALTLALEMAL